MGLVGLKKSVEFVGSGRNSLKSSFGLSSLLARFGPKLTKKELKVQAVSSGLIIASFNYILSFGNCRVFLLPISSFIIPHVNCILDFALSSRSE